MVANTPSANDEAYPFPPLCSCSRDHRADTGDCSAWKPDLKDAEEAQPERKDKGTHQDHKNGFLELEPPTDLLAGNLQKDHYERKNEERCEDSQENIHPRCRTFFGSSPAILTSPNILSAITGSTQGMMLRSSPPMMAKPIYMISGTSPPVDWAVTNCLSRGDVARVGAWTISTPLRIPSAVL